MIHKIYNSSSKNMRKIKKDSVDLIFTSPPYWDLKDYSNSDQIGHKQSYIDYLIDMNIVWKECQRVLKEDGIICININDRYVKRIYYPIHIDFYNQLKNLRLKFFDMYLWHKASGVPAGKQRLTDRMEYIIVASSKKIKHKKLKLKKYKNIDLTDNKSWHIIKKAGSILSSHPHPAFFPPQLVELGILQFTNPKDTVLDPFLGVGNTLIAAQNLGRNSIGFEINNAYINTIIETVDKETKKVIKIIGHS
jgi:modification methylase